MSRTVDERVVEMRFDNKHFEKNVQETMSTLDRLKQKLKLEDAAKGFEGVDRAAKAVSLEGIASGVEALQRRFSVFGIMGMRALENVTDSMMSLANKTVSFLTNGIVQGGINRAMNLENAHFQLQGLLKDEEAVQAVMKNVGDSVDGTAYSLDSAAKVASQFAASGMRAGDQMFSSLRAVAGVAAMTNSEYDEIGRVFTTVAGNGRLMGDQLLQLSARGMNAAATLADYLTKVGEGAKVTEADVREMVSDGEVSFETFAAAMDDAFGEHAKKANETFTGAISNVKSALARIGAEFTSPLVEQNGDLVKFFNTLRERVNDVKANIGPLAEMFVSSVSKMANAATEYLGNLDLTDHFKVFYNVLEGFKNVLKGVQGIVAPIGQAFMEIFPPKTTGDINRIADSFRELTSKFKIGEETGKNLRDTFKGIFAVLDIGARAFKALAMGVADMVSYLMPGIDAVLRLTGGIGKWLVGLDDATKKTDVFHTAMGKVVSIFKSVANVAGRALEALKGFGVYLKAKLNFPSYESFQKLLERICQRILYMKDSVLSALGSIGDGLSECGLLGVLEALWNGVQTFAGGIAEALGKLVNSFVDGLASADFNAVLDVINSLSLSAIAFGMSEFLESISKPMRPFSGVIANVKYSLQELRTTLKGYQAQLKADVLLKIAGAIAVLAGAVLVLSLIDGDKLLTSTGVITAMFTDLMAAMAVVTRLGGSLFGISKTISAMVAISLSVLIMASALKKLSGLDMEGLAVGMAGIIGLTGTIVAAAKIMGRGGKTAIKGAGSLVVLAVAVRVLAGACEDLSGLSWEELGKGLAGVGVLLAEVSFFLNTAKFSGKAMSTATGIVILSAALKILASVCGDFAAMSWEEIGKGLAGVGALLTELALFTKLAGNTKRMVSIGVSLALVGAAMKIFVSVARKFGRMSWEEIGKGLAAMGGSLAGVAVAARMMPKGMVRIGAGLIIVGEALKIMADVMGKLAGFSWEQIGKGLAAIGASLAELAIGLNLMKGTLKGAAALMVAAAALAVLAPVMGRLGAMSWGAIVKGLIVLAGAFAVIGVAGMALAPLIPVLLALGGTFVLMGVAVLGVGVGLAAMAAGLAALAAAGVGGTAAIVSSLTVIVSGVASLIPVVIAKIGEGFIALCGVIEDGAPAVGEAVKAIVVCMSGVLAECVPMIADSVLSLVAGILDALVRYTPQIVDSLFQFLTGLLEGVAKKLPALIQAGADVLMSFFGGIVDALSMVDPDAFLNGMLGVGLLSGIMVALGTAAAMIPAAMVGVLGMGAVMAELALVFAAAGALAQIQGLSWLIGEGGKLLGEIGNAIGSFAGGIVGGLIGGISRQFPQIGADLSLFMENAQGFIAGASKIDISMVEGVGALAGMILALTAADVLNGLASWFTGGSSIARFAEEIVPFGEAIAAYSEAVSGKVDPEAVATSANAGRILSELAANLPNSGGVLGWFMGENNFDDFAARIVPFGEAIAEYSEKVSGKVDSEAVATSANAGRILSELAAELPNSSGIISWFTGDNDLSAFAKKIVPFGYAISEYSEAVSGKIDSEAVEASANAGRALSGLAAALPDNGGIISWFTGDNDLKSFADKLVPFGEALADYSEAVSGKVDVDSIKASTRAGKALASLAVELPDGGGIISWFTGSNDLGNFASKLVPFGEALADYSEAVSGKVDVSSVRASTRAGKALASMAAEIPDSGGLFGWFLGQNNIDDFGNRIKVFGEAIAAYSEAVEGKVQEGAVEASANAGKALAGLAAEIPNSGGVLGWFLGENDMAVFAEKLVPFGEALADYSEAVEGKVKQDAVESSINAGKALAGLASEIPKSGGVLGWFLGENGIDDFGTKMVAFGKSIVEYSEAVAGNISVKAVKASANAGEALAALAAEIPNNGGVVGWFLGENGIDDFGTKMVAFGKSIVEYSKAVSGNVDSDVIDASVNAGKALAGLAAEVPNDGGIISWFTGDKSFGKFGKNLESFGLAMSAYYNAIKDIVGTPIYMAVSAARSVVSLAKDIAGVDTDKMSALGRALNMFGQSGIGEFAKAFVDSGDDMKGAASSLVGNLTTAMGEKRGALTSAAKNAADTVVSALRGQYGAFHSAGLYVTEGFAKGISANTFLAKAKAVQMANDTKAAAERTLQINSPSKVFEEIGAYVAKGFGLGISKNTKQAAKSAENLARVGEAAAWVVADSLNRGSKTFDEFVEKTDKDGNAVELTLERAADAFRKFRNSVKQNIREAISVFDEWEEDSEVTGKKMMENLEYQILGLQEWAGNIRRLARRGMDEGFLKVLSDLGPSGAKYASALMKMSDKSLKKMNTLYRKRMSLDGKAASEIASSFLVAGQKAAAAFGKGLGNQNGAAAAVENLAAKQKSLAQKLGKDASKNMGKAAKYLSFGDAVESIKSGLAYGKGAFQKFVGAYLTAVKNVTVGSKAVKAASKALTAYGQKLYEQSDYYKEDSANIKEHKKEPSALQKQRNKIQKQLKKANKSNTVASRKRAKELKEELSEANKSIKSAKKQIKQDQKDVAAHTKEVFNELRSGLAESVSSFIDPLKASLDTGIELFERFAEETRKVSTTKLLRNMKSQVDGISAWRESLKKLEKKGLADGLLQKLKEMGPDGAKYVDAFLRMTAEELKQANETFARSENLTSETFLGNFTDSLDAAGKWADAMQKLTKMGISQGLLEQLGDMGPDGMDYVNAFLNMIPEQVEELNKKYAKSLKLPESAADKVISSFVYAGGEGVKGFTAALEKLAKTGTKENKALMDAVNKVGNGIQSGLDTIAKKTKKKAKKAGVEAGKKALEGLAEGLNMKKADSSIGVLQTNLKKTVAKVTQGLFDINVDGNPFLKVVDNVSAGLVTSIKANTQSVASAAAGMALGVYEAAKGALEIHSPSKKFQEIGEYADMGFSQGIASGVDGVCATAVSAMGRVIDIISDAVDGGMDIRPTICPVLDLTEVQNGAGRISGILDGVSLSGSDGLAQMAAKGMSKLNARTDDSPVWDAINDLKETLKGLSGTQGDTYNNTFHIQGSSPKEIADEVSHIIQQQVERRRAAWG